MHFGWKNKEKSSSNMNIYLGDIHSITSPPAKLCYVLVVHAKLRGQLADKSRMTGHSTTGKE